MVVEQQPTLVRLPDLSAAERMRLYWGCYWRALLFVLAQIASMVPVYLLLFSLAERWFRRVEEPIWILAGVATVGELCSVVLGFFFVALFVNAILGRSLGGNCFVLVRHPAYSSAVLPLSHGNGPAASQVARNP